ncbi:MAG: ATP-dependent Clp protease ATP-binding subunit [Candidatus Doudnabacteria bacterium]|nr:ATP-dependent Clp protease ATP-binding subunit [Candidatus Doudnabacteria bacterium]
MAICYQCATERSVFGSGFPTGIFDAFFQGNQQPQGTQQHVHEGRPAERVNILDYFSDRAKSVLEGAAEVAFDFKSRFVDTEHLLLALTEEEEVAQKLFKELNINHEQLAAYIEENILEGDQDIENPDISARAKRALELAFYASRDLGHSYVGSEHILLGLIGEGEGMAAQILAKMGLEGEEGRKRILHLIGTDKKKKGSSNTTKEEAKSETPALDKYAHDLTDEARNGRLDPVIGRADEIARVIRVLSRRRKNNPVLIGEPGVGKTAIAEGLAARIVQGNVPEILKNKRVLALDLSGLVAGTKYRGEFEKRLKKVIEEVKKANKNVVLFIDELHTVVGAGATEGMMDAANILKPALARGELQAIGATTLNEYRKHIEKDAALERRFQPVLVNEPSVEITIEILRGLRDKYEAHHKVKITDEAILSAASLSDRYLADRFLPDKAVDLIDEAAAKVRIASSTAPEKLKELQEGLKRLRSERDAANAAKNKKKMLSLDKKIETLEEEREEVEATWRKARGTAETQVNASDIEEVLEKWTGIPVQELGEEEVAKLLKLEERLHERIIGQEEAVKAVSEAIRRGRAGLKNPNRPVGSFIFLGPTGVGKTELTKALAQLLFGDEDAMIRVDMSEYMERHTVSKLIGSPPGYVGHEEGGQLTEQVRRKPYSVILLDEIEKAHPDVFNTLLQILEDGRLTDSKGRTVDFKNTVIIATSNIGANKIQSVASSRLGFDAPEITARSEQTHGLFSKSDTLKNDLMKELKDHFRPEFLNRVDEIIVFHALDKKQMRSIVDILLGELNLLLKGQNVRLEVTAKAKNLLVTKGYDPAFGARPLRRVIQKELENTLSEALLEGRFREGDTVVVDIDKKNITAFTFTKKVKQAKKEKTTKRT